MLTSLPPSPTPPTPRPPAIRPPASNALRRTVAAIGRLGGRSRACGRLSCAHRTTDNAIYCIEKSIPLFPAPRAAWRRRPRLFLLVAAQYPLRLFPHLLSAGWLRLYQRNRNSNL